MFHKKKKILEPTNISIFIKIYFCRGTGICVRRSRE